MEWRVDEVESAGQSEPVEYPGQACKRGSNYARKRSDEVDPRYQNRRLDQSMTWC